MPLTKLAGLFRDMALADAAAERTLSPEDTQRLLDEIAHEYDLRPRFQAITSPKKSHYRPSFFGKGDGTIKAYPLEDILLHEAGHANDFKQGPAAAMGKTLLGSYGRTAIPFVATAAPIIAEEDGENKKRRRLISILSALGGGAAGVGIGKVQGNLEDRANAFAKQHWARTLGSEEAADKKFSESVLPYGRETYHPLLKGYSGLKGGIAGAALGYWISNKLAKRRARQEAAVPDDGGVDQNKEASYFREARESLEKIGSNIT